MKIIPCSILVAAIALVSAFSVGLQAVTYSTEINWTMVYDATALPNAVASVNYSDGTTGGYGAQGNIGNLNASIIDGDRLSFDTVGSGWYTLETNQERLFLNSATGYTVEYRARLLSAFTTETNANYNSGGLIDMNDGRSGVNAFWSLGFGADYITDELFVNISGGEWISVGNDWITYTVTVLGDTATLYMDGVYADSVLLRNTATGEISRWGNLRSNTVGANFEVDSLKIYDQGAIAPIPEPGYVGVGIAALAFTFVLVRRLRR